MSALRDRTHRFLDLKDPLVRNTAVVRVAHNVVEPAFQELKSLVSFRVTMVVRELQESLTSQLWVAQQEESGIRRSRYVPFGRHEPSPNSPVDPSFPQRDRYTARR